MKFFAHSGKENNKSDWQTLAEHSKNVADLAAQMASVFGCENAAYVAGLFHDLGKYNPAFQRRLEGANIRVDHSTAGAALLPLITNGMNREMAKLIGYVIAGHHAGLPDMTSESGSLSDRMDKFKDELDVIWKSELKFDLKTLVPPSFSFFDTNKSSAAFRFAFLGRMIFSCLVDADYKDTERFYDKLENRKHDREWQPLQDLLPQFQNAFDIKMHEKTKTDTDVNRLRTEILKHVRSHAAQTPGLFTLTVPTGGGKTLASLGFALDHAKLHCHDRIIYAIPFTSIIDQTAAIFGNLLGADHILEHHSAIDNEANEKPQRRDWRDKLKLAMEDWAAPIVVTTNVQFFESLFASRTSASRKLHNIANSVIILDEAQTIPRNLLSPCMRVLDELAKNYKCSIVLCTATQPATDARNFAKHHPAGLPLEDRELAPDPQHLANSLRRVTIQKLRVMSNDDLVSELQQATQGLVIVNSRKHALALYQEAKKSGLEGLVHLTTRQCAADRRKILADVRTRLESQQFCRVIATSLIEAGVDVDFPRVWRAEAGLDQIAQAAGRCNREGKRPVAESIVAVFTAPDYPPPAEIKALTGDMGRMLQKHEADLLSPEAIADYFGEVYWRLGEKGLDAKEILGRFKMDRTGTDFSYRSVAQDFRMIESGMVPVIIPMDEKSNAWVDKLSVPEIGSGKLARELQTYTVQVPPKARQLLLANGRVKFIAPKLREDQFAVLTDPKLYTPELGLLWEDADYLSTEALVN
jgi:CRISPR-associated endonuclease/helicase Cas3